MSSKGKEGQQGLHYPKILPKPHSRSGPGREGVSEGGSSASGGAGRVAPGASGGVPGSGSPPVTLGLIVPKPKRGAHRSACDACRAKKSACNAERPVCSACRRRKTPCVYGEKAASARPGAGSADTSRQDVGKGDETAGETAESIERGILRILRRLPETQAVAFLGRIREQESIGDVFIPQSLSLGLSQHRTARAALPPTQTSLEFELMMRHPIAYPSLLPVEMAFMGIDDLLRPRLRNRQRGQIIPLERIPSGLESPVRSSVSGQSSGRRTSSSSSTTKSHSPTAILPFPARRTSVAEAGPDTPDSARLCDERLAQLDMKAWSDVAIDNETAAKAISLYLETDHPILGFFDSDLFLADLVSGQQNFCSPLLVSSLLAWSCRLYSHFDPEAATLSRAFREEASHLLDVQQQNSTTLTTVAAAGLMSLDAMCRGDESLGLELLRSAIVMGKTMGLYDVETEDASARAWLGDYGDWIRAASHTAWGMFCWVSIYGLHLHTGKIEDPPLLPVPGDEITSDSLSHATAKPLPGYMGQTFTKFCHLCRIVHRLILSHYDGEQVLIPVDVANVDVAEKIYHQLLDWADSLPLTLARGSQNSHHVVTMHIFLHAAVVDLFRPLDLQNDGHLADASTPMDRRLRTLKTFSSSDATATAASAASHRQLQRLLLLYRTAFPSAAYSMLWHTAPLYVANAAVREARLSRRRGLASVVSLSSVPEIPLKPAASPTGEAAVAGQMDAAESQPAQPGRPGLATDTSSGSARTVSSSASAAATGTARKRSFSLMRGRASGQGGAIVEAPWRRYFRICLAVYRRLARCFPVVLPVVRGLLVMAISAGAMEVQEAALIMREVTRQYEQGAERADMAVNLEKRLAESQQENKGLSLVVDLDLAMRDRTAAQLQSVANKFAELTMFDEFTNVQEPVTTRRRSSGSGVGPEEMRESKKRKGKEKAK